jgi:hypothetical protein
VAILWIWAGYAADRRYAALDAKVKAMVADLQARDGHRPVLHGEAQPGNSWDDYTKAVAELRKAKGSEKLYALVARRTDADPAIGERLLADHASVIDHLRRGAARSSSRTYDWDEARAGSVLDRSSYDMSTSGGMLNVSYLVQLKARSLSSEGKTTEAVETLLDLCQLGRDFAADGPSTRGELGLSYLGIALHELKDLLASVKMDSDALSGLEGALKQLDESFPRHDLALQQEGLSRAVVLLPECSSGVGWGRLMTLDSLERLIQWHERAAQAERTSWSQFQKVSSEAQEDAARSWNPLFRMTASTPLSDGNSHRAYRARLRLLRVAVRWQAKGVILDLEDPFGAQLMHTQNGNTLKVWSVGRDRVDDGGSGTWEKSGKDIVLEIGK